MLLRLYDDNGGVQDSSKARRMAAAEAKKATQLFQDGENEVSVPNSQNADEGGDDDANGDEGEEEVAQVDNGADGDVAAAVEEQMDVDAVAELD